jgi:rubrerythrin
MRSGAIGLRQLAEIPPDTPVKLAMHLYAFEHLEIAAYEFLARIARESGDQETADAAERILEQEREAAEKVQSTFDRCVELLGEQQDSAEERDSAERQDSEEERDSAEKEDSAEEQGSAEQHDSAEEEQKEGSPA